MYQIIFSWMGITVDTKEFYQIKLRFSKRNFEVEVQMQFSVFTDKGSSLLKTAEFFHLNSTMAVSVLLTGIVQS